MCSNASLLERAAGGEGGAGVRSMASHARDAVSGTAEVSRDSRIEAR